MAFNWTCPYCDRAQSVVPTHYSLSSSDLGVKGIAGGPWVFERQTIACANQECAKATVAVRIGADAGRNYWHIGEEIIFQSTLLPQGRAKPQPEYIPKAIREDYKEACLIRDLSPKASATLARRCLQGMIRDFCGIVRGTLDAEIKALDAAVEDGSAPRAVSVESVQAIDHVRKVGNIGAHMEKDIDHIIEVDAGEAQALIDLVELLLREWYVDRYNRQQRLASVEAIRIEKDQAKLPPKGEAAALPAPSGG